MTYGAKTMIPLEANFLTLRTNSFTPRGNDELLGESLDLIEEERERKKKEDGCSSYHL